MEKHKPELKFMVGANEILEVLSHSKEYGNVIGICSPVLGPGIFITTVDKIVEDYETVVYLKPYSVNGIKLDKSTLRLTEISSVCAFRSHYNKLYHEPSTENSQLAGTDIYNN